jgi:hypothetical protein
MVLGRRGPAKDPPGITNLNAYVDHVVQFSLAGIHKIKNESVKNTLSRKNKAEIGKKGAL